MFLTDTRGNWFPDFRDGVGEPHLQSDVIVAGLVQRVRLRDVELCDNGLTGRDLAIGVRCGVSASHETPVIGNDAILAPNLQEVEHFTFEGGVPDQEAVIGVAQVLDLEGERDRFPPAIGRFSTDCQTEVVAHRFGSSQWKGDPGD
ncbi:hypothetical protein OG863_40695 [Streptomyces decoyicus]|uniref:Uncharacterized protein n=1 Tax=Streptomyces decoyicus TaxID=249567 RepID=A0ABZ1FUJ7_9ACTN|nr:hypothetical protein [Streptomyces decoyicus]WSB73746.1 hypothetical protein OG863_40695 [Streptomyces decoyicus]